MESLNIPDFGALLARLTLALEDAGLPFMVIGGQAVLLHGDARLTRDVDVTLGAGPDRIPELLRVCAMLGLVPLPEDPSGFARRTFVLPAEEPSSGLRVDFILSTTPFERQALQRAGFVALGGARVPFASAEDLVLLKLFAGRPRDLEDAVGVVRRKGGSLDWEYLDRWAHEFAVVPGREDLPRQMQELRREHP